MMKKAESGILAVPFFGGDTTMMRSAGRGVIFFSLCLCGSGTQLEFTSSREEEQADGRLSTQNRSSLISCTIPLDTTHSWIWPEITGSHTGWGVWCSWWIRFDDQLCSGSAEPAAREDSSIMVGSFPWPTSLYVSQKKVSCYGSS